MPRRLKVKTTEKGFLEVYVITESPEGKWELGWENLRSTFIGRLISRVPRSVFNHVLNGYSQPFVDALGLPPEGALQKLPSQACGRQRGCSLYQPRNCIVSSKKLPWCYEPAGMDDVGAVGKRMAGELVFFWKEGVYVIAVYDD